MTCVFLLLMIINVVVVIYQTCLVCVIWGASTPPFILMGEVRKKVTKSVIIGFQSRLYFYLSILHIFL
jgi:hypothetical protein